MEIRDRLWRLAQEAEAEIPTLVCQECGEELRVRDGIELDLIAEAWAIGARQRGVEVYGETPQDVQRMNDHPYGWAALRNKATGEGLFPWVFAGAVTAMGLRGRIKKLTQQAEEEAVLIRLRDGSTRVFTVMDVQKELFLAKCDLAREEARSSPVLEAVRQATPVSRAAFVAEYGTITPGLHIVASVEQAGWVEVYRLEVDGTVMKVRHEEGTPEGERLRERART